MQSWLKFAGTSVLVLGLVACGEPEPEGTAAMTLTPSPRYIDDTGQSTTLRISATDATSKPGTGDVLLTAGAGLFGNGQKTITVTLDDQGKGSTTYSCAATKDTGCKGFVRIEGDWNQTSNGTSVQVTSTTGSTTSDAGTGTGGTDAGTGTGGTDAGTGSGGTDAGSGGGSVSVGAPANIVFLPASAKEQLGIRSSGLETATPLSFAVLDLANNRVKDVEVTFSVVGPAGVSLTAVKSTTDTQGTATVLLQSGDEVGVATVTARVTGTALSVSTPGTPIVGARVSDEGFVVSCEYVNMAANATETPPRLDLTTDCNAKLVDRFKNPVTLATSVTWYSEAGSIQSPVTTETSIARAVFSTAGKWPPVPVSPAVSPMSEQNEPSVGTYNPRDMLVTLIAVTSGEEEFYDGSGVSNGVKDGKWNPGEWFVDVPEPFVDANDNQVFDPGEQFIDTERVDCATGTRQPKNGKWDGPNGCWDGDTMLWRPTHIVYSGFNTRESARWTLTSTLPVPYSVAKGGAATINVTVTDAYLNRMSPDGAKILAGKIGDRGSIELPWTDGFINSRTYGFQIVHERVEATVDPAQPRGYKDNGTCDPGKSAPSGAGSDPKLARCVRQYHFGRFGQDNVATLFLKGMDPTDPKPAQTVSVYLTAGNAYSATTNFFSVTFQ
jgi:hypothetical protein